MVESVLSDSGRVPCGWSGHTECSLAKLGPSSRYRVVGGVGGAWRRRVGVGSWLSLMGVTASLMYDVVWPIEGCGAPLYWSLDPIANLQPVYSEGHPVTD